MPPHPPMPDIEALLPHRGRMLLIDRVLHADAASATSAATVGPHWPMFDGRGVSSLMAIELVAQTCGLSNGLRRIAEQGADSEKKGFLVGIKSARLHVAAIAQGTTVITEARNRFVFETFREIEGTARVEDHVIGEVVLQVIQAAPGEEQP